MLSETVERIYTAPLSFSPRLVRQRRRSKEGEKNEAREEINAAWTHCHTNKESSSPQHAAFEARTSLLASLDTSPQLDSKTSV